MNGAAEMAIMLKVRSTGSYCFSFASCARLTTAHSRKRIKLCNIWWLSYVCSFEIGRMKEMITSKYLSLMTTSSNA